MCLQIIASPITPTIYCTVLVLVWFSGVFGTHDGQEMVISIERNKSVPFKDLAILKKKTK